MNTSDLMKAMAEAGAPFDAILIAVRALEEKDAEIARRDADAAEKRAKDAERKRIERASRVHGQSADSPETVQAESEVGPSLSLLPNENKSNPTTHTHPEKPTPRTRKGTRLPVDWLPAPLPKDLAAAVASWPDGAIERELSRFRDWAASAPGSKGVKSDWDATWRNWLRTADDEGRHRNGKVRSNGFSPGPRNGGRPVDHAVAYLTDKLGLSDPTPPSERREAGPGAGGGGHALARPRTGY